MTCTPLFLIPANNKTKEELLFEMVYQLELHGFKVKGKPKGYKEITIKSINVRGEKSPLPFILINR